MDGAESIREPRLAIIGGTGLGTRLRECLNPAGVEQHEIETPFGLPSDPVTTGRLAELEVALLPRHGDSHQYNPTNVPYRANMFAL